MAVFWDGGFSATSIDDLTAGTGLNKPSLYGAFGDKRALYRLALQRYREQSLSAIAQVLGAEASVRDAFRALYRRAIGGSVAGGHGPRGCLMIGTALTESVLDEEVRAFLRRALVDIEDLFEQRLRRAVDSGDLLPGTDPKKRARLASAILHSLAVWARAGTGRDELQEVAEAGLEAICA